MLPGSGLSSSAACEVLLGVIENRLFCGGELDAVTIAQLGQRAENVYFGKPSGLMDQMASSVGGAVAIDFADPPAARWFAASPWTWRRMGYALCIIDSGASHAALTGEYASIPEEVGQIAAQFGKRVLREVDEAEFMRALPELRQRGGRPGRAACDALFRGRPALRRGGGRVWSAGIRRAFLALVRESGRSSWELLQNITPTGAVKEQAMAVALDRGGARPWRAAAPAASTAAASPAPYRPSCPWT